MTRYKCGKCGYVFTLSDLLKLHTEKLSRARCPRCTYEIIYKVAKTYRIVRAI